MECIKYKLLNGEESFVTKIIPNSVENIEIAKIEAHNGEYEILDYNATEGY